MDAVRLTLRIMRLPAAVLLLVTAVYIAASWHRPVDQVSDRLLSAAVALQGVAGAADAALLREIAAAGEYERVWIVQGNGVISASSHSLEPGRKLESPWLDLLSSAAGPSVTEGRDWGERRMFMAAHRSAQTGRWSVILQDGRTVTQGRHRLLLLSLGSAIALLLLVASAVYLVLERTLLRPLLRLETAAEAALAGDSSHRSSLDRLVDGTPIGRIAAALGTAWSEMETLTGELKEQRALYFSAMNLAREMVLIASFEGTILDVNRSFCERFARDRQAVVGKPLKVLEKQLPVDSLVVLGERSAQEQRVFDRLIFTLAPGSGEPLSVVAAVQAVPFGGQAAFMLVADDRTNEQALATRVSELLHEISIQSEPVPEAKEEPGGVLPDGGEEA